MKKQGLFQAKGKRMWHYPANSTMRKLKQLGYSGMIWENGDFLMF